MVFVCFRDQLQWWKQGVNSAEHIETVAAEEVERFFQARHDEFSPDTVYRAKTWGRFKNEFQRSFVDVGLMPLVEEQVSESLGRLIENGVGDLKKFLGWTDVTDAQGQWLLQTVFWLISAKILHDKEVANFGEVDLDDVEAVFGLLGEHYGTAPLLVGSAKRLAGLRQVAHTVSQFSSLVLTTTEALAYVNERTLVSEETRTSLNTHSTPPYLVDYIVGGLADWIADIDINDRNVFEPACGHASFLVSVMRLLSELLPDEKAIPSRRGPYLRKRLHGIDKDSFSIELARLSLTLTDIPNPNGWDLTSLDMFSGDDLAKHGAASTIILANPPFGDFSPPERERYQRRGSPVRFLNKSVETLWRTLPHLPEGGVFGAVVPQTLLHSKNAKEFRRFLLKDFELKEICLFPDRVFSFSDAECAIILGRRVRDAGRSQTQYARVRERDRKTFRSTYVPSVTRSVNQSRFTADPSFSLRLPDLDEIWSFCARNRTIGKIAEFGQGFQYRSNDLQAGAITTSDKKFDGGQAGFVKFDRGVSLSCLPKPVWLNLDPAVISRPRAGTTVGVPQVLLNYGGASNGPWRLKALIDKRGHPVTSRFIAVRRKATSPSIEVLWALLNSPVANAYAFSHLRKRDNVVGVIRNIPIPNSDSFEEVEHAANEYLEAAALSSNPQDLQSLLLKVDSQVLKLYSFTPELEHALLSLFNDWKRVGVPFAQTRYLPKQLEGRRRLADFLIIQQNRQRYAKLVDKKFAVGLTEKEEVEQRQLEDALDEADRVFYEPIKDALAKEIERLMASARTDPKGSG
jgi:hypothetical protein